MLRHPSVLNAGEEVEVMAGKTKKGGKKSPAKKGGK
jgi:hypothetical protein